MKKHTLRRKFKAWMLWQDRFWSKPENKEMLTYMFMHQQFGQSGIWL
jgi:ABC-type cobalamin transport system ATPase subunit